MAWSFPIGPVILTELQLIAIGLEGRFDRASLERRFRAMIESTALVGEGVQ